MSYAAIKTVGLQTTTHQAILSRLSRHAQVYGNVAVSVVAGAGERTAAENAVIGKSQAGMARSPWYLTKDQLTQIHGKIRAVLATGRGYTSDDLTDIGRMMIRFVKENVEEQENASGTPFRPLTEKYAEWKRKTFGNQPILRASGELLDTLKVEVGRP